MGQLKDQMLMEMRLRNFSPSTIKAYVWYVANFTKHFGKSPAEMGLTKFGNIFTGCSMSAS